VKIASAISSRELIAGQVIRRRAKIHPHPEHRLQGLF
jgi:hypothetical protein